MAEVGEERKQFVGPTKDQIIAEIKQLDDEIEHVSLNLIKCDFNAEEKDVEKAFPDFKFIKIKKYNPGSFEVIFEMKIDAINFIRNSNDRKILSRRFYIKLGRQHKEMLQDWACIGYVPRNFKTPGYEKNRHKHSNKSPREKNTKLPEDKTNLDKPTNKEAPEPKKQSTIQVATTQVASDQVATPQAPPQSMGKEIPEMGEKQRHKKKNYERKKIFVAGKQADQKILLQVNTIEKKVLPAEVKTEIKAEKKTEVKAEVKTEVKAEVKTEVKTEMKAEKVKDEKVKDEKVKDEKVKDEKVKAEKVKDEKVKAEKVKDEKVKAEKVKDEKVKDEKVKDEKVKGVSKAEAEPKKSPKVQVDEDDGWVVVAQKKKKR